jgi:hypothetical protein
MNNRKCSKTWFHRLGSPITQIRLGASDIHLFSKLKEHLREHHQVSDDEVKTVVWLRFRHQEAQFYRDGLTKLIVKGKGKLYPITTTNSHKGSTSIAVLLI